MIDGIRRYGPTVPTIEEAVQLRAEMVRLAGTVDARPRTLQEAIDLALEACQTPDTADYYRDAWAIVQRYFPGNTSLSSIDVAAVEVMRDRMLHEVKPATVNRRLALLRRAFSMAIRAGWVQTNPASSKAVRWPREDRAPMDYFEPGELRHLVKRIQELRDTCTSADRVVALVVVLANTGMRRSELVRSRREHWNLHDSTVHVEGKRGGRMVQFPKSLAPYVQTLLDHQLGIERMTTHSVTSALRAWQLRLEEPRLHAHAMRHTYGTSLVRNGADLFTVMAMMGHQTPSQTKIYFHACGKQMRAAADGLRLLPDGV